MKKWKNIGLVLLLSSALLAGCSIEVETTPENNQKEQEADSEYCLYEINDSETDLVEKDYTPKDKTTEGMIQELEQMIVEYKNTKKGLNILPEEVNLLNHELSNNVLTLNFDAGYRDMGIIREILVRAALVKNFIQVPEVSAIQIKVAGMPLTDSKGQEVGNMNAATFTENMNKNLHSYQFANLTLYFASEDGAELVPEERKLYYMSNIPLERVVLEQLVKGPAEKGSYATLPKDLNILSVVNSDGVCYINFDDNFISDALMIHPEITVYSIVNSIIEACNVERVQISVGGDSSKTFRDIMDLNQFYEKNEQLIQKTSAEEENLKTES